MRFRFSLKQLAIVFTVLCVAVGWALTSIQFAKTQWRIEQEVLANLPYNGNSDYLTTFNQVPILLEPLASVIGRKYFDRIIKYDAYGDGLTDENVKQLSKLKELRVLSLSDNPKITNSSLAYLQSLPHLEKLYLDSTNISDEGMNYISECRQLRSLHLYETSITDAGLMNLGRLSELETLVLSDTAVGDKAMEGVRNCGNLCELRIAGTRVTDKGLLQLRNLQQLRRLDTSGPLVTEQGKKSLLELKPDLQLDGEWLDQPLKEESIPESTDQDLMFNG